jgi:asparagine synthase (glutamine-hydrolysing)
MCGIAGIVANHGGREEIGRMTSSLAHRGPDGAGAFLAPGVGLGHRRLAILDLSPAGAQPMLSRDGRFTIALNGEIFNYLELRAELPGPFRSRTDTEVLLEACAAWGVERTLARANGMFAFALWDARERELILARDRSGEKPLVYFWDGETFAFSSELKALKSFHSRRLDPAAVDAYLALGYVPAPLAIFRDCRKVPAGHLLRLHSGQLDIRRWWFPEGLPPLPPTPGDLSETLRALLADSVRLRLRADVPVALALSGGVDSSIVAAECAGQAAAPEAFTIVFDGDAAELPYARLAARHLGLRHHVIPVSGVSAASQFELAAAYYDEPFADTSALPALALARVISQAGAQAGAQAGSYKLVLSGDGGDEAFAGYPHYQHIAAKQLVKAAAAAAGMSDGSGPTGVYVQSKTTFQERERGRLLAGRAPGDSLARFLASDSYLPHASGDALHQALWRDRHLYLPNDLTFKMDIALGAFGLEGRAPFLDHRILEWAQTLPSKHLVRGTAKKVLLRRAYRGRLPEELLSRPKRGFGSPIGAWLAGPLQAAIKELLPCPLLDRESQGNCSGQRLWTLLTFARWAQTWSARW